MALVRVLRLSAVQVTSSVLATGASDSIGGGNDTEWRIEDINDLVAGRTLSGWGFVPAVIHFIRLSSGDVRYGF